jgi:hypothetical protein
LIADVVVRLTRLSSYDVEQMQSSHKPCSTSQVDTKDDAQKTHSTSLCTEHDEHENLVHMEVTCEALAATSKNIELKNHVQETLSQSAEEDLLQNDQVELTHEPSMPASCLEITTEEAKSENLTVDGPCLLKPDSSSNKYMLKGRFSCIWSLYIYDQCNYPRMSMWWPI